MSKRTKMVSRISFALLATGAGFLVATSEADALSLFGQPATLCLANVPDLTVSGDKRYSWENPSWNWCKSSFMKHVADEYGASEGDWSGFGWANGCDVTQAFGRLMTANISLSVESDTAQFTTIDSHQALLRLVDALELRRHRRPPPEVLRRRR